MSQPNLTFSIGEYNILADTLAQNLKPWFWYGYRGIPDEAHTYIGDHLDRHRKNFFGIGRSNNMIRFWILGKQYFKLFDDCYPYCLHIADRYPEGDLRGFMKGVLKEGMLDFFERDDTGRSGNSDLLYHLFRDRSNYELWASVIGELGVVIGEDDDFWFREQAEVLIRVEKEDNLTERISEFNCRYRGCLVEAFNNGTFDDLLELIADFVTLSNVDINSILKTQKIFDWENRKKVLADEVLNRSASIWCFSEFDNISLRDELPQLELAIWKKRKTSDRDDGSCIFYDPSIWKLKDNADMPNLSYLRYSAEAQIEGKPLQVEKIDLPFYKRYVYPEHSQQVPNEANSLSGYTFTQNLKPKQFKEYYDERVAIFSLLTHIETNIDIIVISTHLMHTQKDQRKAEIKLIECQQLNQVLELVAKDFGVELGSIPIILAGDLNEASNYKYYGGENQPTFLYDYLASSGWNDCFNGDCPPTTYTLSREYCIDYIFTYQSQKYTVATTPGDIPKVYLGGYNEEGEPTLVKNDQIKPVWGLPIGPIEDQPQIPSDHLPITCKIEITFQNHD